MDKYVNEDGALRIQPVGTVPVATTEVYSGPGH